MKLQLLTILLLLSVFTYAGNGHKVIVMDENNQPLTGVRLTELSENEISFTDFDGISALEDIRGVKVYKIEYSGYKSGLVRITPNGEKEIEIVLEKR